MKNSTKFEIVASTIVIVMIIGTVAYHQLEGWGYIDSFYFTGMTVTTIGYGDLYPTTSLAKIFTVFFAFGGVSIMLFALSLFATNYFESREKHIGMSLERRFVRDVAKSFDKRNVRRKRRLIVKSAKDL